MKVRFASLTAVALEEPCSRQRAPPIEHPPSESVLPAHPCYSALTPDQVGEAPVQNPAGA